MHRLSTQKRLLLLAVSLTVLFFAGLVWLFETEEEEAAILLNDQTAEKARLLEILIWARNEPSRMLVYDYSYWDEMVDFVRASDSA